MPGLIDEIIHGFYKYLFLHLVILIEQAFYPNFWLSKLHLLR